MKAAGNTQTICDINSYKYTRTHTHTCILVFSSQGFCIFSCNYSLCHIWGCISPRGHLLISRSICILCRCGSLSLSLSLFVPRSIRASAACKQFSHIMFGISKHSLCLFSKFPPPMPQPFPLRAHAEIKISFCSLAQISWQLAYVVHSINRIKYICQQYINMYYIMKNITRDI